MFPARTWRENPQRYRLEGQQCSKTKNVFFPPRRVVPGTLSGETLEPYTLPSEGTIYTFTRIDVPPNQFKDAAPYVVGIVELRDGTKIMCQIADTDEIELEIGQKVKLEFRRVQTDGEHGVLAYGYKAVPAIPGVTTV
jgi:uncharacterized OB-fold protein